MALPPAEQDRARQTHRAEHGLRPAHFPRPLASNCAR
jgi:hypothetical protein